MITIIPAGNGGSTPTPTPGQQLKIVSKDDSLKVFENDEDETERNIERFNFLAAEDIDNGASCYFNFVEEDNAGAGAKNLVEYVINTKEGRKINFSMICPYSPTSLDDFTIKITGDVLEDDGFYIELYSDPGDGEGNRYQGYFGVIWFYSASFYASGGDPDQQFFVQVAGDKTNVNWQWLGLSPEAYERLILLQDEGYYMRDFWEGGEEGFKGFLYNINSLIADKYNIIYLGLEHQTINIDDLQYYHFGILILSIPASADSIFIRGIKNIIADFSTIIDNLVNQENTNTRFLDFGIVEDTFILPKDEEKETVLLKVEKAEGIIYYNNVYVISDLIAFSFSLDNIAGGEWESIILTKGSTITFGSEISINNGLVQIQASSNGCVKSIDIPDGLNIWGTMLLYGFNKLESIDLSNHNIVGNSLFQAFYNCIKLTTINLSGCDLSQIKNIQSFCSGCSLLTEIDLSGCDLSYFLTASSSSYHNIFYNCNALTTIKAIGCNADTIAFLNSVKPAGSTVVTA